MADTHGKIRGRFDNDLIGFAQWVGRKIRNHDPMSERDGLHLRGKNLARAPKHRSVKDGKPEAGKLWVGMTTMNGEPSVFYGLEDGRVFKLDVQQVELSCDDLKQLKEIGL